MNHMNRRTFLKVLGITSVGGGSLGLTKMAFASNPPASFPENPKYGGQVPEASIDLSNGKVNLNPDISMRNSACLGCYSACGNRVKVDSSSGEIMSVTGNPYNPINAGSKLLYDSPVTDAYLAFGGYKDMGLNHRATLCSRGNATIQSHYDPMRILVPLKRAGKRGEGNWKPITWEQAVNETVEGGKLFAETGEDQVVDGLRQVRDLSTPLDSEQPEFGAKANQFVFIGGRNDGRTPLAVRCNL
ncbi:MAG: putative anaerobic dehydrogenase [Firmicutes bacterium]|nr:putative anaerobic dehydrogenase [Bacillota bacterium]